MQSIPSLFLLPADLSDALLVGPMLIGSTKPIHVLTPTATARGIANLAALTGASAAAASR